MSPSAWTPSPAPGGLINYGSILPPIAAGVFVLALLVLTFFRKKSRKLWDTYNVQRYRSLETEYNNAAFPRDLPQVDDIHHKAYDDGVELSRKTSV